MSNRLIEDPACGIVIEIVDGTTARVLWRDEVSKRSQPDRVCRVDARLLALGRWIPMQQDDDAEPPIYVVCRATALVVGASIKADVLEAMKGLP